MTEVIAVFRSRAQAVDCNMRLRGAGVPSGIINTPKEANIGCGLSVKVPESTLPLTRRIVRMAGYSAFFGFYKVSNVYGRTVFTKIG